MLLITPNKGDQRSSFGFNGTTITDGGKKRSLKGILDFGAEDL